MIDKKYNIVSLTSANQCFFKYKKEDKEVVAPVINWALTETKDAQTNAFMRLIVGIYINEKGGLCVCEESDGFVGYSHRSSYHLVINN